MATFQQIQQRVQRRVIDLPAAVLTEVPSLVNAALKELQRRHDFKVMEATAEFTTTVAVRAIGVVPADFKKFRGEPYYVTDLGPQYMITEGDRLAEVGSLIENDDEGFPRVLLRSEPTDNLGTTTFDVYPLPDGQADYNDGEYRIRVPYWRYLPALAASGVQNWFTNEAEEWLVMKATAEAFGLDWDEERMTVWLQKAEREYSLVVAADKRQRLGSTETLVPHWQGARTPQIRYP